MNFSLTSEQKLIFETAKKFGSEFIAPNAVKWEVAESIPKSVLTKAGDLGFGSIYVSEENGGMGLSRLDATLIFEALAMACPSVSSFISIHNMCTSMIANNASEKVKNSFLPALLSMEEICSYCLTEPDSGSDAAALKTTAEKTNEGYNINGTKSFISGGGFSDLYLVMARTGDRTHKGISAFLIRDKTTGLTFGKNENKMGWRAQPTAQLNFSDCKISSDSLLGEEGLGFFYAMRGLDGGRLNIAAAALGGAQKALDIALEHTKTRSAFGKKLCEFQGLQFRLADIETDIQAARIFLRQAAWKLDKGALDAPKFCAMSKRFVTDTCFNAANQALQILGGYGYLQEYGIEKIVRDLRVHQILEGTNEIMRVIIARALLEN